MPIEFRCTQCNRLLRTQAETAGKKAKCPECGAILTIPSPGSTPEAGAPPPVGPPRSLAVPPSPAFPPPPGAGPQSPFGPIEPPPAGPESPFARGPAPDAENPYASPIDYTVGAPAAYAPAAGRVVPTRIAMGEIFSSTWTIYKSRIGILVGVVLIFIVMSSVVAIGIAIGQAAVEAAAGDPVAGFVAALVFQFAGWLFNTWIGIGLAICLLRIARGEEVNLGEIFGGGPYFLTVLVASILIALMMFGIILLCYAAGAALGAILGLAFGSVWLGILGFAIGVGVMVVVIIVVGLMFSMFQYLIIDRNAGIIESLALSTQITRGNKGTMFVCLVLFGLAIVGACVAGILVTGLATASAGSVGGILVGVGFALVGVVAGVGFVVPYVSILWVVMYLHMSGQPTLAQGQTGTTMV